MSMIANNGIIEQMMELVSVQGNIEKNLRESNWAKVVEVITSKITYQELKVEHNSPIKQLMY